MSTVAEQLKIGPALNGTLMTLEELQAIVHHDGQYVLENRGVAHREHSLALLLQFADTWQGHIIEKAEKIF